MSANAAYVAQSHTSPYYGITFSKKINEADYGFYKGFYS